MKAFAKDSASLFVSLGKTATVKQSERNPQQAFARGFYKGVLPDLVSPMFFHRPFGEFEGGTDSNGSGGDIQQQPCGDQMICRV